MPIDYVMQGMIADTGGDWKLFERHRTIGMIDGILDRLIEALYEVKHLFA